MIEIDIEITEKELNILNRKYGIVGEYFINPLWHFFKD